ncbi:hypothetical protein F7725_004212 [Dissostichus mawsoni]|uniref:TATA box binding protein associated factor (TAF) histone-like fold domain-containing protein n=1 Tax=Dissostichus mawsoni TaxID=36200 RepID=A0A7J5XKN6_DISMA|nr:hypothetical protein F7725_004212 [Dissostichus mawsoni]
MADREERRFAEVSRDSVKLMAESSGVELGDDVATLLAEDVCYRLREATQVNFGWIITYVEGNIHTYRQIQYVSYHCLICSVCVLWPTQSSSQFMRHAKRRKLTVEDFNRALRWSNVEAICGYGAQDALPFRSAKEGELFFIEDRDINLVELALATNIPKGCAETLVRVNVSYLDGKGNLEPQGTDSIRGPVESNSKIAALLPYFVYVISGVKSVSHDLEQLNRLLHMVKSLVQNPNLYLGSYVRSLVSSVMTHGDLVSGLYHQILLSLQKVLSDPVRPLCSHYGAVVGLHALGWKVRSLLPSGNISHLVVLHLPDVLCVSWQAVERVLFPHLPAYWANLQAVLTDYYSVSNAQVKADGHKVYGAILVAVERLLKMKALSLSQPAEGGSGVRRSPWGDELPWPQPPPEPLSDAALGIASHLQGGGPAAHEEEWTPVPLPAMYCELYSFFGDSLAVRFSTGPGWGSPPCTLSLARSSSSSSSSSVQRSRSSSSRPGQRSAGLSRDVFPKARFIPPPTGLPVFTFLIGGRQMGRRCQGRRPFQTNFAPPPPLPAVPPRAYAHKLPVIGRVGKPVRRGAGSHYSLHLPL